MNKTAYWCALAISLFLSVGCGPSGIERFDVSGTVTFNGNPVPHGRITFRPDRSKGASGPAGFAAISDGEFDTYQSGKGSAPGPMVVSIEGFKSSKPMAPALFAPYLTAAEVSADDIQLDFEVPAGASNSWFERMRKAQRQER